MEQATNLEKALALVNGLSLEELRLLNNTVYDRLKVEQGRRGANLRFKLKTGDRVCWNGRHGAATGVIVRVKRVKAIVKKDGSYPHELNWDVPLSMLSKV